MTAVPYITVMPVIMAMPPETVMWRRAWWPPDLQKYWLRCYIQNACFCKLHTENDDRNHNEKFNKLHVDRLNIKVDIQIT